jgi:kinesin family protein C1
MMAQRDLENVPPGTKLPRFKPSGIPKPVSTANLRESLEDCTNIRPSTSIPQPMQPPLARPTRATTVAPRTRSASSSLERSRSRNGRPPSLQLMNTGRHLPANSAPSNSINASSSAVANGTIDLSEYKRALEETYEQKELSLQGIINRLETEARGWQFKEEKLTSQLEDLSKKLEAEMTAKYNTENRILALREEHFNDARQIKTDLDRALHDKQFVDQELVRLKTENTQIRAEKDLVVQSSAKEKQNLQRETDTLRQSKEAELMAIRTENLTLKQQLASQTILVENTSTQLQHEKDAFDTQRRTLELSCQETIQQLQLKHEEEKRSILANLTSTNQLKATLQAQLNDLEEKNLSANREIQSLRQQVTNLTHNNTSTTQIQQDRIQQLQDELEDQKKKVSDMRSRVQLAEAARDVTKDKLLKEEIIRRKLHNQIQELKGNIRVFCRVRPPLSTEQSSPAKFSFPDEDLESQQLLLAGPTSESATGNVTTKIHPFSFDRVFAPRSTNNEVFDEISQLVQSALDGYNVCIFAYGQTGSGKTYTMSAPDGMIPQAVDQIFQTADNLRERGWKYQIEGQFLEIYNETINDLLGKPDDLDKGKLEIRHDPKLHNTTITDITTVTLDSPARLKTVLQKAASNRSVAATKANERSSRSHSVFILRITGENAITGHRCDGTLNLIDLAGSERLAHSQATGARLKETQSINKSLTYLGDVIYALGAGKEGAHIPYRNSKLTYLLQYSLSGKSKTLMFVNVSPMEAHVNETLSSLRFATKVNNTRISK